MENKVIRRMRMTEAIMRVLIRIIMRRRTRTRIN
jgi:hypothetical protein